MVPEDALLVEGNAARRGRRRAPATHSDGRPGRLEGVAIWVTVRGKVAVPALRRL
jgi:hypothetical protein